mgnify:CR=1 FL=1
MSVPCTAATISYGSWLKCQSCESVRLSKPSISDKSINKFVQQYLISNRNNKTILLCDIDPTIYYLDYTCVCYDHQGKVCKMVTVKEKISSRGVTKEVELSLPPYI